MESEISLELPAVGKEAINYIHPHVRVIDEIGYLSLRDNAANVLFQVVNERYLQRKPILFTTPKPLAAWGQVLHDPDLAEAILDRILEEGRHIQLRGPSYRTRHHHKNRRKTYPSPTKPLVSNFPEDWCQNFRDPQPRIMVSTEQERGGCVSDRRMGGSGTISSGFSRSKH